MERNVNLILGGIFTIVVLLIVIPYANRIGSALQAAAGAGNTFFSPFISLAQSAPYS